MKYLACAVLLFGGITLIASKVFRAPESTADPYGLLGIYSVTLDTRNVEKITVSHISSGQTIEWLSKKVDADTATVLIQLALPENQMRVAISSGNSGKISSYRTDDIAEHPLVFTPTMLKGRDQLEVLRTSEDSLGAQNGITIRLH